MSDLLATVHVAVAVIVDTTKQYVLISLRQAHQHQGGLWEFPGGKVDDNETVFNALVREVDEELGLSILEAIDQYINFATIRTRFSDISF
jgi:8-oxo-dGTP diphosphatase